MVEMAKNGNGNPYYGDTAADLFEPFVEEFDLIANLYARDAGLSLTTPTGVTIKVRNDYPIAQHEGFLSIRLPDLPFRRRSVGSARTRSPCRSGHGIG